VCTDGKDNNCDGVVDCVSVVSSFPQPDGAAANEDVQLKIAAPAFAAGTYAVQCAVKRPATIGAVAENEWVACAGFDPTTFVVKPPLPNPAEGKWALRIRLKFTSGPYNGRSSAPSPAFPYYLHNSMAGASLSPCVPKATDAAFFAAADDYFTPNPLGTPLPKFVPSGASKDTFLANPWIRVRFTPPVTNRMSFGSYASPVDVDMVSLRRRFVLDASNELLLVTRNYPSRVGATSGWVNHCEVGIIRKHDSDIGDEAFQSSTRDFWNRCDAWVLNRAGAGVCLRVVGTSVVAQNASSKTFASLLSTLGITWPSADNWMWRKLQRNDGLFSRKCWTVDCNKTDPFVLFLPDRALPGAGFP
jgi:hypothetical protein